jgi:hypothetical protein
VRAGKGVMFPTGVALLYRTASAQCSSTEALTRSPAGPVLAGDYMSVLKHFRESLLPFCCSLPKSRQTFPHGRWEELFKEIIEFGDAGRNARPTPAILPG